MLTEFTLFPLNSVLYPDGSLSLSVLKPRYLSMVSYCCRQKKPFIAVTLKKSSRNRQLFNEIGTLTTIKDFNMPSNNILEIHCRGTEKVKIINHHTALNNLILGQIEPLATPKIEGIPEQYQILVYVLKNHLQRDGMKKYNQQLKQDWDNPDWLGCRLSELLPLNHQQHYELFIAAPLERLEKLKKIMKKKSWL